MKKIFTLVIASSLLSGAAMATVGANKEVDCKNVVKRVKEKLEEKNSSSSNSEDDKSKKSEKSSTAE